MYNEAKDHKIFKEVPQLNYMEESLRLHGEWQGKIEVVSRVPVKNKDDLSVAYTPGVAQPCLEIQKDYDKSFTLTAATTWWPSSPTAPPCWAWATSGPKPVCP